MVLCQGAVSFTCPAVLFPLRVYISMAQVLVYSARLDFGDSLFKQLIKSTWLIVCQCRVLSQLVWGEAQVLEMFQSSWMIGMAKLVNF